MRKKLVFPFLFLVFFFIFHEALAQIAPAPSVTLDNITSILEKGGQFTTFIKLLKATQVADQLNNQLSTPNPNDGLTIFALSDNAFSGLKPGTLNSLSDQEKLQLIQFHILPTLMYTSQFQTASNPLRTQAGDIKDGNFTLNVTTAGGLSSGPCSSVSEHQKNQHLNRLRRIRVFQFRVLQHLRVLTVVRLVQ